MVMLFHNHFILLVLPLPTAQIELFNCLLFLLGFLYELFFSASLREAAKGVVRWRQCMFRGIASDDTINNR